MEHLPVTLRPVSTDQSKGELAVRDGHTQSASPPIPTATISRRPSIRAIAWDYALAVAIILPATLLRLTLQPALKHSAPFPFYFLSVICIGWYVGLGPAIITTILGGYCGVYLFLSLNHSLVLHSVDDKRTVFAYYIVSIVVALISNAQRTARTRAEQEKRIAEEESARRRSVEVTLRRQQAEIEVLNARLQRSMAETHHRVKNNLQVIASMVELQTSEAGESVPTDSLRRIGQHVQSLATIHDILTREVQIAGDVESLETGAMLGRLRSLLASLAGNRGLTFTVADLSLPIRQGTYLAVLINELVSNAVKHGAGAIDLSLTLISDRGRLQVRDRGPGFPQGFDPDVSANTGLDLVQSVSRWDLEGDISFGNHPEGGALVTVTFPIAVEEAAQT